MGDATLAPADSYVKFSVELTPGVPPEVPDFANLVAWRQRLFDQGLVGMYPNGVGFGNLSLRYTPSAEFLITGTATGELRSIDLAHCVKVARSDINANKVWAQGELLPSSECLTHAALYQGEPSCTAVVHVHNLALWQAWRFQVPTTSPAAAYGTPAMANEVSRLLRDADLKRNRFLVMGGHEKGIITFGHSMAEAVQTLLNALARTPL